MRKMDIESNSDFVYRVDRKTLRLKLQEEHRVQIAVSELEPSVRSAISFHGPKTLDDVRVLADRVQASTQDHIASTPKQDFLQQILTAANHVDPEDPTSKSARNASSDDQTSVPALASRPH